MNNEIKKKSFRYYAYGYLNGKYILLNRIKKEEYKTFKRKAVLSYLKLDVTNITIQNFILLLLRIIELPFTLVFVLYLFVKYIFTKLLYERDEVIISDKTVFFVKEPKMQSLIEKARLRVEDFLMVTYPGEKLTQQFEKFDKVSVLPLLSYYDLFKIFVYSIEYCCYFYFKFKNDFLFRLYSCYEFFATMQFIEKLGRSNTLLCTETYTRWAFMMSDQNHNSVFLQHGMIGDGIGFLKKVGSPDIGYFINKDQITNCCYSLFINQPVSYVMDGLKFTGNDKLITNGKKHLLLVCRYTDYDLESKIVRTVTDNGEYNLYVKPHPLYPCDNYKRLSEETGCVLLGKTDYPKVDVVISYKSTLALEYADAGIVVLRHDQYALEKIFEMLSLK